MILITGATGRIGRKLVRALAGQGEIRVLLRPQSDNPFAELGGVTVFRGDVADASTLPAAFEGVDEVVHLAATMDGTEDDFIAGTLNGTRNVIHACLNARVSRLLYTSSLSVLALGQIEAGDEVDESWPYEPRPELRGFYTKYKLLAEQAVVQAVGEQGLRACILRPGEVLDPQQPHLSAAAGLRAGPFTLSFSSGDAGVPLVAVEDLVQVMVKLLSACEFQGEVIHVVDPHHVTQRAYLSAYRHHTGTAGPVVRFPLAWAMALLRTGETCTRPLGITLPLTAYRLESAVGPRKFSARRLVGYIGEWSPAGVGSFLQETDTASLPRRSA